MPTPKPNQTMNRCLPIIIMSSLVLSGCGSVTGFSNAFTDFGCQDASGKPSCRNISAVYEENNPDRVPAETAPKDTVGEILTALELKENKDFVVITPVKPRRRADTVLRVWLAPYTDKEGDLHDQRYMYVKLQDGGWTTESVQELASQNRTSKPVYPLSASEEPSKEEKKRENLKKLPAFGFGTPAVTPSV